MWWDWQVNNACTYPDGHPRNHHVHTTHHMMMVPLLPVLVDPVDGELEVGILALDPDVVPREVVQSEAARTRHLRLARAQVDVHLQQYFVTLPLGRSLSCRAAQNVSDYILLTMMRDVVDWYG